jgi:O-antigen/teichoic acid export membrane protein
VSLDAKVNRGVAWAAGGQAIIAIADLVSNFVAIALLPAATYGTAFATIPFYTALDYAADVGVTSALIQRDDHTPERVSTVFWFNVLVSGAMALALLGLGPLYGAIQGSAVVGWLLAAYGIKLVIQNAYAIPFALLKKELRFSEIAVARVIAHLSESVSRIVFVAAGAGVWSWTYATLVRASVFAIIIQLRHPFVPKLVFRWSEVKDSFVRFGVRNAASNVLYQLYTSMDSPIIFYFFGETANGIYGLADYIVLEPVKTIANVVTDVALPTFARVQHDRPKLIAQFLKLTRLNLIAVLPFVGLVLLVIPEVLSVFKSGGEWNAHQLELCGDAARILCVMGLFRAAGLLGPPLLDGIGKPELTLRYMVIATLAVPTSFWLGAVLLGDSFAPDAGFMSVALAWGIGYPIAFAALAYLVLKTIALPVRDYLRAASGIVASCGAGVAAGFAMSYAIGARGDLVRLLAIGGTSLAVTLALLARWQKITPRSIAASMRG